MLNFSNLTTDEVIRYADIYGVPGPLLKMIEQLNAQISEMEVEASKAKRQIEIAEEQAYFARELIGEIDKWAEGLPKTKQAAYKVIRDNTQFET